MDNKLVTLQGNEVFTNSKVIAEGTGNQHHAVQQIIQKYENDISDFGQVAFEMRAVKYQRGTNQEKVYLLNEEQATFVITLLRNSKEVVKFKKELVRQFYSMRQFIFEKQTKRWIQTREQGKITRKAETEKLSGLFGVCKKTRI